MPSGRLPPVLSVYANGVRYEPAANHVLTGNLKGQENQLIHLVTGHKQCQRRFPAFPATLTLRGEDRTLVFGDTGDRGPSEQGQIVPIGSLRATHRSAISESSPVNTGRPNGGTSHCILRD